MGVKLGDIIPKKQIEFEDLSGKRIAIDFSNMAFQFLSSIRQPDGTPLMDSKGNITSVYIGIFSRITNLISKGILPCFVFDGKPPVLKLKQQQARAERKEIAKQKYDEAKEKQDIESMYKYAKQTSKLTEEIIKDSKELLKALGLPVIQAPSESDAQISFMAEKNDVWAAASSDHDCLLFGCPKIITNLTLSQRRKLPSGISIKINPKLIELSEVLKSLGLNQDQLIVLGILIGTDYNPGGIKGIGPKTALNLLKEHSNFEELFDELKPDFNWKQIYAIFKSMPIMKNYQLKWTPIDENKIKEILIDKHEFSEERVEKTLSKLKEQDNKKQQTGLKKWV